MKTIIVVPDTFDNSKNEEYQHDDICQFLESYFNGKRPENLRIYHGQISQQTDVTPQTVADIEYLQSLGGTIYVVKYGAMDPVTIAYLVVVAIMAAFSIYTILTMPKPNNKISSSNNELQGRTNGARLKSRIPDIYGQVRSYPDLIAVPYTEYVDGTEVEYSLMCIGRGYYKIHDVLDGQTNVVGISGTSVSIYNPDTSLKEKPLWQAGDAFTDLPIAVTKSSAINGQSLSSPNNLVFGDTNEVYFTSGGVMHIRNSYDEIDLTTLFKANEGIAITGASFGVADALAHTGKLQIINAYTLQFVTDTQIDNYATYAGIKLVLSTATLQDSTQTLNLSGDYDILSIDRADNNGSYTYTIKLSSPKQVNYDWNYVKTATEVNGQVTFNKNTAGINLSANYSIGALDSTQVTLVINSNASEWEKLDTLFSGTTINETSSVTLELLETSWIGWYTIQDAYAEYIHFNVYYPQGLYGVNSKGAKQALKIQLYIEYQLVDSANNPISAITSYNPVLDVNQPDAFGSTYRMKLPTSKAGVRFRIAKSDIDAPWSSNITTAKIKDVFTSRALDKDNYPGVTVVRTKTVATDGALSVKERKLNCLVTRMLEKDGTGERVATKDAGQALINMALDPHVGRRSTREIDIEQIKAEIIKVRDYFTSTAPTEFCYTFDDDKLSFEEQASMIASTCFCETTRFGNKLRLKFEQPQANSVLLFNHRNKVPSSEKRTYKFGIDNDYDGLELEYTSPDDDSRVTYKIPTDGTTAKNPQKISTSGIRNHAVAKTRAWREWNKLQYAHTSCEFDALDESELLQRNDRILVADNTSLDTQDGEVIAVDALTLSMSQDVTIASNAVYYCYLQLPDGSVDMIECKAGEFTNQVVLVRAPLKPLVVDADRYVKTLYTIVTDAQVESQAFMLTELTPNDQMTNKLTCMNYTDQYYEKDHTFI